MAHPEKLNFNTKVNLFTRSLKTQNLMDSSLGKVTIITLTVYIKTILKCLIVQGKQEVCSI